MTKALAKIVQKKKKKRGAKNAQKKKSWKWTKTKRKAIQFIVKGYSDTRIGKELEVHRNTLREWKKNQEFHVAILNEAREYVNRTRFKRVHETGIVTDQIAHQLGKRLLDVTKPEIDEDGNERPKQIGQIEMNSLQMFLREYREFRNQERSDFGDNVKRVEGKMSIGITGGDGPITLGDKGSQSFKRFVEENNDSIPQRVITSANNPQEALIEATRELIRNTDIVEDIHREDDANVGEQ
jgi:hypothetical protein